MAKAKKPTQTQEEKVSEYAKNMADEIIKQLENGTAAWQKPWEASMGNDAPYNASTGKPYRGSNKMALYMQDHADPRWLTYNQANEMGAQVKRGAKGVSLLMFVGEKEVVKRDAAGQPIKNAQGDTVKEKVKLDKPIIKTFYVFNAEHIDGLPELKRDKVSPEQAWANIERAEKLLDNSQAKIEHKAGDRAFYRPSEDKIVLPEKSQFQGDDGAGKYYSTALHELGHWTGHPSRLDRNLTGGFGSESYAKEELRAEISSMFVNREMGLPHDPSQHASYVSSWVKVLKDDPQEIIRACRDAEKIKDFVMTFDPQQEKTKEAIKGAVEPTAATKDESKVVASPEPVGDAVKPVAPTMAERFEAAKNMYEAQNEFLPKTELKQRQDAEILTGQILEGMPSDTRLKAEVNYFESQVKRGQEIIDNKTERKQEPKAAQEQQSAIDFSR